MIVHVDFTNNWIVHDPSILNDSPIIRYMSLYFDGEEQVISDTVFQGGDAVQFPLKINQGRGYRYRSIFNRDIHIQRIFNEWVIGALKNRFRLFFGRWPLEKYLRPMMFESACILCNKRWRQTGAFLVPLKFRTQKTAEMEAEVWYNVFIFCSPNARSAKRNGVRGLPAVGARDTFFLQKWGVLFAQTISFPPTLSRRYRRRHTHLHRPVDLRLRLPPIHLLMSVV